MLPFCLEFLFLCFLVKLAETLLLLLVFGVKIILASPMLSNNLWKIGVIYSFNKGMFSLLLLGVITVHETFKLNFLLDILGYYGKVHLEFQLALGMIFAYETSEVTCLSSPT